MKVRVLYNKDGSVSVIYPAPKSRKPDETESEWLNRVFEVATPNGAVFDDVDSSELPDRSTRAAWRGEKGKGVAVDINKIAKPDIDMGG